MHISQFLVQEIENRNYSWFSNEKEFNSELDAYKVIERAIDA